jgi:hypothetical protein
MLLKKWICSLIAIQICGGWMYYWYRLNTEVGIKNPLVSPEPHSQAIFRTAPTPQHHQLGSRVTIIIDSMVLSQLFFC